MPPIRRSIVWKYFIKKDRDIVRCKICKKDLRFNSSTTNMKAHLKCKSHAYLNMDANDGHDFDESDLNEMATTSQSVAASESMVASKRICVDSQVISYQKLVVPIQMRSLYWKFYGFPANDSGEILTKAKIVCLICKIVLSYNRNTTNLRTHLQNKHLNELSQIEGPQAQKIREALLEKKRKKKEGSFGSTSMSGSVYLPTDDPSGQNHFGETLENYETHLGNSGIGSSHLTRAFNNKMNIASSTPMKTQTDMDLVEGGGEQSCTIESLHPYMIPIEMKSVSDAVTEFIIIDMQLPDIVEGRGFQRLIANLKSPCEIPSKNKLVEEIIPRVYDSFKESIQESLQTVTTDIALCVEEWGTISGDTYTTFSLSYKQDKDDHLSIKVLSTVRCPTLVDKNFWELVFNNLVAEWSIRLDKMKVVVFASTRQDLIDVFTQQGLIIVPCLVHTIQEVCTSVCLDQDDVREVLEKCRTVVYLIYKNTNALAALRIQDHLMMLEEAPLVTDFPKLWVSTYVMLEALVARRQVIRTVLDNIEPSTYDKDTVNITDQDWNLIDEVISVLEPFKVTMMTLCEERTPLVSLIKPLLHQLLSIHLQPKEDDSVNVQLFKTGLKGILSEKYNDSELNEFLNIASTLDPRFKSLPNISEESKPCMEGPVKEKLTKLIEESPKEMKPDTENLLEKKKPKLLGMVMMLGDICPATSAVTTMSIEGRSNLELVQYQSESSAPLDQCPLAWWRRVSNKCPHLSLLAAQYYCVPASATPSSRLALDSQLSYEVKRANMMPEIIDRIIFLNANYSL